MYKFMLIFAFISSSAFACPDLTGFYKSCFNPMSGSQVNQFNVEVSQATVNGVTTYTVKSTKQNDQGQDEEAEDSYVANNKPVISEYDEDYSIETTSWCEDNQLKVMETLLLGEAPLAYAEGAFFKYQDTLNIEYQTIDTSGEVLTHYINCK